MSAGCPIVGPFGIQLKAIVTDGELSLVFGQADEPGATELALAICKMVDLANLLGASGPERDEAHWRFCKALEALHLAATVAT